MTLVRHFSFLARATSSASFVDTVGSASGAAVYPSSSKLSCSASSLHGHCPASSVLQADPPPLEPWRSLGIRALLPLLMVSEPHALLQFHHPSLARHAVLYDPGRVSGAVAITHAYWCLPAGARGRPLLYECHGARSLHSRYGLSVDLSTLRHGRCLACRWTGFPSAGWALTGRESHPLDECGFVWTHAPSLHGLRRWLPSLVRSLLR